MKFTETRIEGAYVIAPERLEDERGFFSRVFCREEFANLELTTHIEQANLSGNAVAGTVRGMHYQVDTASEAKLVRCVQGALYDVAVDLRPDSPTFGDWVGAELTGANDLALLVPEGCAHGFQTLVDETKVLYHVSAAYDQHRERGIHHADPTLDIEWPLPVTRVSTRDAGLPFVVDAELP